MVWRGVENASAVSLTNFFWLYFFLGGAQFFFWGGSLPLKQPPRNPAHSPAFCLGEGRVLLAHTEPLALQPTQTTYIVPNLRHSGPSVM